MYFQSGIATSELASLCASDVLGEMFVSHSNFDSLIGLLMDGRQTVHISTSNFRTEGPAVQVASQDGTSGWIVMDTSTVAITGPDAPAILIHSGNVQIDLIDVNMDIASELLVLMGCIFCDIDFLRPNTTAANNLTRADRYQKRGPLADVQDNWVCSAFDQQETVLPDVGSCTSSQAMMHIRESYITGDVIVADMHHLTLNLAQKTTWVGGVAQSNYWNPDTIVSNVLPANASRIVGFERRLIQERNENMRRHPVIPPQLPPQPMPRPSLAPSQDPADMPTMSVSGLYRSTLDVFVDDTSEWHVTKDTVVGILSSAFADLRNVIADYPGLVVAYDRSHTDNSYLAGRQLPLPGGGILMPYGKDPRCESCSAPPPPQPEESASESDDEDDDPMAWMEWVWGKGDPVREGGENDEGEEDDEEPDFVDAPVVRAASNDKFAKAAPDVVTVTAIEVVVETVVPAWKFPPGHKVRKDF